LGDYEDRVALLREDHAVWAAAVERLDLPLADLLEALGPERLQAQVEARLREGSRAIPSRDHDSRFEPIRLARLLKAWQPGPIEACLAWPLHHPSVVGALERALWGCDRSRAVAWLAAQLDQQTGRGERVLARLAEEPHADDRPLL